MLKNKWNTFLIRKNKHRVSNFRIALLKTNKIRFSGIFDESCLYTINNNDRYDINKFFGLSDNFSHIKDSIRLGWNCLDNKSLNLYLFAHVNGKYVYKYICNVLPNKSFNVSISITKKTYIITVFYENQIYRQHVERKSGYKFIRYILFPYFGGNNRSPKNMFINIFIEIKTKFIIKF